MRGPEQRNQMSRFDAGGLISNFSCMTWESSRWIVAASQTVQSILDLSLPGFPSGTDWHGHRRQDSAIPRDPGNQGLRWRRPLGVSITLRAANRGIGLSEKSRPSKSPRPGRRKRNGENESRLGRSAPGSGSSDQLPFCSPVFSLLHNPV